MISAIIYANLEDRKKVIGENHLCFKFLRTGHHSHDCKYTKTYFYCEGNHNRALCDKNVISKSLKSQK